MDSLLTKGKLERDCSMVGMNFNAQDVVQNLLRNIIFKLLNENSQEKNRSTKTYGTSGCL